MARRRRGQRLVGTQGLRRRIERWRDAGRPGKRMPEELWGEAVALAREHGAYRIASELGLSYWVLKQRAEETGAPGPLPFPLGHTPQFVEIDLGEAGATSVIEFERGDGVRLRIRLGPRERLDLGAVTAAFVSSARR